MFGFVLLVVASISMNVWLIGQRGGVIGWTAAIPFLFFLIVAASVFVAVGGRMRRFISPLHDVMDAADKVAAGDYAARVDEQGSPPMRALTHSFNTMTERLQNTDRIRRDLMGDIAHELRTPLSVLQGRIEGLLDGVYARDDRQISLLLEETQLLSRLVDDLRTLALSEAGALPLQKEPTDLAALARDVASSMESEADRHSVLIDVKVPAATSVAEVDPLRIREVLINLLSNAIRHSRPGSRVTVSVDNTPAGVTLGVTDGGAGMSPDERARIFDRFYKGEGSRGSGLGLTIAKGIVTAHGGTIEASSELGRGTTITCAFPTVLGR